MAYTMYMDDIVMPVMPSSISCQTANKNETIELISGKEINIPKPEGLLTLSFDLLLPGVEYPFAYYADGLKSPSYFLDHFKKLKASQKPFQLIIARVVGMPETYKRGEVKDLNWTNIKVTMEDYPQEENAENGFDIKVSVTLKQWEDYESNIYEVDDGDDEEEKDENGEVIQEPTLTPILPNRRGSPEGIQSASTWQLSKDKKYAESSRMVLSAPEALSGSTVQLKQAGGAVTITTVPALLNKSMAANKVGVVNYSLSGVLIDSAQGGVNDSFLYRDDQNIFDIMAKRFGLSRSQTKNVTRNGVMRYGLNSIVWAFTLGADFKDPWSIERNVVYEYSLVAKGLREFAPVLTNA